MICFQFFYCVSLKIFFGEWSIEINFLSMGKLATDNFMECFKDAKSLCRLERAIFTTRYKSTVQYRYDGHSTAPVTCLAAKLMWIKLWPDAPEYCWKDHIWLTNMSFLNSLNTFSRIVSPERGLGRYFKLFL